MTTGEPPKRSTAKRGRPAKAEGKREGFEKQVHISEEEYQKFKRPGPQAQAAVPK